MTALVDSLRRTPEPPRLGPYIAALLEVFILCCLMIHGSIAGIVAWVGYFYFSATRWLIFDSHE